LLVLCREAFPADPAALMLHVITKIIPAMITGKKTAKMTVLPMSDTFLSPCEIDEWLSSYRSHE
jgi:hypothetical protein